MPLSETLLIPFKKFFKAPVVETPISTIKMPSTAVTTTLVFISFFVIVGGFIFCYVNNMPLFGYARNQNGQIYQTWIDTQGGLSSQLLAEGILCSFVYTLGAASVIAAFYAMSHEHDKDKGEFVKFMGLFGCSTPIWMFLAFQLFRMKIPSYFPKFRA
ncbi:oligosaccharyltransferase complex subunit OSTC-like [Histomonas meleagridis]|uniref:oligosaccharyltransferase complex subunit OSTC-like n=1 Tax=Histomonas meleagridis TaxID=135588 RepID=UPI0035595931|nr:oligosaccharyltransferase complex subunit OSTC-like [Histomonas meleagridis]KAH0806540.1 oligosaccharyltransferase complex subunit OSTC-like [Histomonas meleagridis]